MKNIYKPLLTTIFIASAIMASAPVSAHQASRHGTMAGTMGSQSISGQNRMDHNQMGQAGKRVSRMQHRRDHRLKQTTPGYHQKLESHNNTANDPDFQSAFSDE